MERKIYKELINNGMTFKIKRKGVKNPNYISKSETPDEKKYTSFSDDLPSTKNEFYKFVKQLPKAPGMVHIKYNNSSVVSKSFIFEYDLKDEFTNLKIDQLSFFQWALLLLKTNKTVKNIKIEIFTSTTVNENEHENESVTINNQPTEKKVIKENIMAQFSTKKVDGIQYNQLKNDLKINSSELKLDLLSQFREINQGNLENCFNEEINFLKDENRKIGFNPSYDEVLKFQGKKAG